MVLFLIGSRTTFSLPLLPRLTASNNRMDDVFDRMLDAPEVDSRKRKRADNFDDEAGPALPPSAMQDSGQSAQDIEQMLEDADANEVDSLDHTGL